MCGVCKPFGKSFSLEYGLLCALDGKKIERIHKFRVGDVVKIREDLISDKYYDGCRFDIHMKAYIGKYVTIKECYHSVQGRLRYKIDEERPWVFSEAMFET